MVLALLIPGCLGGLFTDSDREDDCHGDLCERTTSGRVGPVAGEVTLGACGAITAGGGAGCDARVGGVGDVGVAAGPAGYRSDRPGDCQVERGVRVGAEAVDAELFNHGVALGDAVGEESLCVFAADGVEATRPSRMINAPPVLGRSPRAGPADCVIGLDAFTLVATGDSV